MWAFGLAALSATCGFAQTQTQSQSQSQSQSQTETTGESQAQATQDPEVLKAERRRFQEQELITAKRNNWVFKAGEPPRIVWRDIDEDPDIDCVILTGNGRAFSAGGDFTMIEEIMSDERVRATVWKEARDLVYNIINCGKPIISAINGVAVGAGLAVALRPLAVVAERLFDLDVQREAVRQHCGLDDAQQLLEDVREMVRQAQATVSQPDGM